VIYSADELDLTAAADNRRSRCRSAEGLPMHTTSQVERAASPHYGEALGDAMAGCRRVTRIRTVRKSKGGLRYVGSTAIGSSSADRRHDLRCSCTKQWAGTNLAERTRRRIKLSRPVFCENSMIQRGGRCDPAEVTGWTPCSIAWMPRHKASWQ